MNGLAPRVFILFGRPYSGKGTQAAALAEKFDLAQISTGDLLRAEAERDTERGRLVKVQASKFGSGAGYVSDELIVELVRETMLAKADKQGFVFDGFPRTVQQARIMNVLLTEKNWDFTAIELQVPQDELLKRALSRMVCQPCQRSYAVRNRNISTENICPVCHGALTIRREDMAEYFPHRMEEYEKKTLPVLELYQEMGTLKKADGMLSVEEVSEQISKFFI